MWSRLWSTPQATQWEAHGQHDEVAMYVRSFTEAAIRNASATARGLVVRQQEMLGLSEVGLARHRWRIGTDGPAKPEATTANDSRRTAGKARFKTIEGGAA
jgi:hypothetical protein